MSNRRDFVKTLLAGSAGVFVTPQLLAARPLLKANGPFLPPDFPVEDAWAEMPEILARIKRPIFPKRDFKIIDHGAVAGGSSDCTDAIRKAIDACRAAGGGRVVVSPGVFLTGAIHLRSNVNLFISEGATLKFSTDPAKYLPVVFTRFEGTECLNFSPPIYAFEQENIAITGPGVVDGQASKENWWAWARRAADDADSPAKADIGRLLDFGQRGVPVEQRVFGAGHFLRPNFIQLYRCRNVLIEEIAIRNSPMWEIHPVLSVNVTVRGVKISSHGPNNDGCNPESSRDVLIEDCVFDTGDDCIAIKSGRDNDGRRVATASENIVIRNCTMKDGHGGVVMGSEMSGNIRNVYVENCHMDSPNLDRAFRIKSNARRGGIVENIFARNVEIGRVAEAVLTIDFLYETGAVGEHRPVARNILLEKIQSSASPRVMWIVSFPGAVIEDVRFVDCIFRGVQATEVLQNVGSISFKNITIEPAKKQPTRNSRTSWP
jgi:polygalacturonase